MSSATLDFAIAFTLKCYVFVYISRKRDLASLLKLAILRSYSRIVLSKSRSCSTRRRNVLNLSSFRFSVILSNIWHPRMISTVSTKNENRSLFKNNVPANMFQMQKWHKNDLSLSSGFHYVRMPSNCPQFVLLLGLNQRHPALKAIIIPL